MNAIQSFGNKSLVFTKAHSPEILAVVGVGATLTGTVLIARATLKLPALVQELEDRREAILQDFRDENITEKEMAKLVFAAQRDFVIGLIKIYGIGAAVTAAGVSAMLGAQNVLKKRNVALLGAYKTLEQAYAEYRKRVVETVGEEEEEKIRLNLRAMQAEDADRAEGDPDDKPMALLTEEDRKKQALGASPYAVFFDRYSTDLFSNSQDDNMTTLRISQASANHKLQNNGHLFLNDVYKMLGLPTTEAGQYVGWTYADSRNEVGNGDQFVDFGLDSFERLRNVEMFNDGSILLDFNVDGTIIDKVWKK